MHFNLPQKTYKNTNPKFKSLFLLPGQSWTPFRNYLWEPGSYKDILVRTKYMSTGKTPKRRNKAKYRDHKRKLHNLSV
jgi:hypothetical protein